MPSETIIINTHKYQPMMIIKVVSNHEQTILTVINHHWPLLFNNHNNHGILTMAGDHLSIVTLIMVIHYHMMSHSQLFSSIIFSINHGSVSSWSQPLTLGVAAFWTTAVRHQQTATNQLFVNCDHYQTIITSNVSSTMSSILTLINYCISCQSYLLSPTVVFQ